MNTTSHIEAFNAELMDAKREALAAIRAIVRTANQTKAEPGGDPRILAQARMAATQVLRAPFLDLKHSLPSPTGEMSRATASDREGTSEGQSQVARPPAPVPQPPAPAELPTPADQRRAAQIERIAQQAARDLERYQRKLRQREEREHRRAGDLTARAGAGSPA